METKSDEETEEYDVERILGERVSKNGTTRYKVRWLGYGADSDTWEPIENLISCKDLLDAFFERKRKHAEKEKEGSKSKKHQANKKLNFLLVSSSDEEANTVKDNFWELLAKGQIPLPEHDLYTNVKSCSRTSLPVSLNEDSDGSNNDCSESKDDSFSGKRHSTSKAKHYKERRRKIWHRSKSSIFPGHSYSKRKMLQISRKDGKNIACTASAVNVLPDIPPSSSTNNTSKSSLVKGSGQKPGKSVPSLDPRINKSAGFISTAQKARNLEYRKRLHDTRKEKSSSKSHAVSKQNSFSCVHMDQSRDPRLTKLTHALPVPQKGKHLDSGEPLPSPNVKRGNFPLESSLPKTENLEEGLPKILPIFTGSKLEFVDDTDASNSTESSATTVTNTTDAETVEKMVIEMDQETGLFKRPKALADTRHHSGDQLRQKKKIFSLEKGDGEGRKEKYMAVSGKQPQSKEMPREQPHGGEAESGKKLHSKDGSLRNKDQHRKFKADHEKKWVVKQHKSGHTLPHSDNTTNRLILKHVENSSTSKEKHVHVDQVNRPKASKTGVEMSLVKDRTLPVDQSRHSKPDLKTEGRHFSGHGSMTRKPVNHNSGVPSSLIRSGKTDDKDLHIKPSSSHSSSKIHAVNKDTTKKLDMVKATVGMEPSHDAEKRKDAESRKDVDKRKDADSRKDVDKRKDADSRKDTDKRKDYHCWKDAEKRKDAENRKNSDQRKGDDSRQDGNQRKDADDTIRSSQNVMRSERKDADDTIRSSQNVMRSERKDADDTVRSSQNVMRSERKDADDTIRSSQNVMRSVRKDADDTIRSSQNVMRSERKDADETIRSSQNVTRVPDETTVRYETHKTNTDALCKGSVLTESEKYLQQKLLFIRNYRIPKKSAVLGSWTPPSQNTNSSRVSSGFGSFAIKNETDMSNETTVSNDTTIINETNMSNETTIRNDSTIRNETTYRSETLEKKPVAVCKRSDLTEYFNKYQESKLMSIRNYRIQKTSAVLGDEASKHASLKRIFNETDSPELDTPSKRFCTENHYPAQCIGSAGYGNVGATAILQLKERSADAQKKSVEDLNDACHMDGKQIKALVEPSHGFLKFFNHRLENLGHSAGYVQRMDDEKTSALISVHGSKVRGNVVTDDTLARQTKIPVAHCAEERVKVTADCNQLAVTKVVLVKTEDRAALSLPSSIMKPNAAEVPTLRSTALAADPQVKCAVQGIKTEDNAQTLRDTVESIWLQGDLLLTDIVRSDELQAVELDKNVGKNLAMGSEELNVALLQDDEEVVAGEDVGLDKAIAFIPEAMQAESTEVSLLPWIKLENNVDAKALEKLMWKDSLATESERQIGAVALGTGKVFEDQHGCRTATEGSGVREDLIAGMDITDCIYNLNAPSYVACKQEIIEQHSNEQADTVQKCRTEMQNSGTLIPVGEVDEDDHRFRNMSHSNVDSLDEKNVTVVKMDEFHELLEELFLESNSFAQGDACVLQTSSGDESAKELHELLASVCQTDVSEEDRDLHRDTVALCSVVCKSELAESLEIDSKGSTDRTAEVCLSGGLLVNTYFDVQEKGNAILQQNDAFQDNFSENNTVVRQIDSLGQDNSIENSPVVEIGNICFTPEHLDLLAMGNTKDNMTSVNPSDKQNVTVYKSPAPVNMTLLKTSEIGIKGILKTSDKQNVLEGHSKDMEEGIGEISQNDATLLQDNLTDGPVCEMEVEPLNQEIGTESLQENLSEKEVENSCMVEKSSAFENRLGARHELLVNIGTVANTETYLKQNSSPKTQEKSVKKFSSGSTQFTIKSVPLAGKQRAGGVNSNQLVQRGEAVKTSTESAYTLRETLKEKFMEGIAKDGIQGLRSLIKKTSFGVTDSPCRPSVSSMEDLSDHEIGLENMTTVASSPGNTRFTWNSECSSSEGKLNSPAVPSSPSEIRFRAADFGNVRSNSESTSPTRDAANSSTDRLLKFSVAAMGLDIRKLPRVVPPSLVNLTSDDLGQAVFKNDVKLVQFALERVGAIWDLEQRDASGQTLVMAAVHNGNNFLLRLLVERGALVNARKEDGTTPLMIAAQQGFAKTVGFLLCLGARIDDRTCDGETALIKAARQGHDDVVYKLLDNGANFSPIMAGDVTIFEVIKSYESLRTGALMHIHSLELDFDFRAAAAIKSAGILVRSLFPLQCLTVRDMKCFRMSFNYESPQPLDNSFGMFLFIGHAFINYKSIRCLLKLDSYAVKYVTLNGHRQKCVEQGEPFLWTLVPLCQGINYLNVHLRNCLDPKVKLVMRAYQVMSLEQ